MINMEALKTGLMGLILLTTGVANCWAQDDMPYTAEFFMDVYEPLEDWLPLNVDEMWDVPIDVLAVPFPFPCFGGTSDLLRLTDVGGGIEIHMNYPDGSSAFHLINGTTMDLNDVLIVADSTVTEGSTHRFTTEGEWPNQLFKLEFNNVGFDHEMAMTGAASSTAHFQIWLYENGTIEIHYGPNTITDIADLSFWSAMSGGLSSFWNWEEYTATFLWANGIPSSPLFPLYENVEFDSLQGSPDFTGWSAWPENGQVYRFNYANSVDELPASAVIELSVYPNPATDRVTLSTTASSPVRFSISDSSGRVVEEGECAASKILDVSAWSAGIYTVQAEGAEPQSLVLR